MQIELTDDQVKQIGDYAAQFDKWIEATGPEREAHRELMMDAALGLAMLLQAKVYAAAVMENLP